MKDVGARLERRRLIGMRGNEDALARGVIFPMMIGADHAAVAHLAERELCAAMDAKVFPGVDARGIAPNDDVTPQQPQRQQLSRLHPRRCSPRTIKVACRENYG